MERLSENPLDAPQPVATTTGARLSVSTLGSTGPGPAIIVPTFTVKTDSMRIVDIAELRAYLALQLEAPLPVEVTVSVHGSSSDTAPADGPGKRALNSRTGAPSPLPFGSGRPCGWGIVSALLWTPLSEMGRLSTGGGRVSGGNDCCTAKAPSSVAL